MEILAGQCISLTQSEPVKSLGPRAMQRFPEDANPLWDLASAPATAFLVVFRDLNQTALRSQVIYVA